MKKMFDVLNKIKTKYIIALVAAICISVFLSVLPPLVLENIIDSLAGGTPILFSAAVGYFAIVALSGFAEAAKEGMIIIFGQKVMHGIRTEMCQKLNRLPASYFVDHAPGEIVSHFTNDVQTIDNLFSSGIISMFADVCKMAAVLFVVYRKSLGLGLMLTVVTPILFVMTRQFQKRTQAAQTENLRAIGSANQQIPEAQKNLRTISLLRKQPYMIGRYSKSIDDSFQAQERSNFYDSIYSPIIIFISSAIIGIVMALAAQNGMMREFFGMSVGTAAALIAYVGSFFEPLESIGMALQNIQSAISGIKRISDFLGEEEDAPAAAAQQGESSAPVAAAGSVPVAAGLTTHQGRQATAAAVPSESTATPAAIVSLSHVDFSYAPEKPAVLKDFSMEVEEGEDIVLMGRTGAGKSTILKLIVGLYTPQNGKVSIGGQDPRQIAESERRKSVGYVQQQFSMISGTVGEQVSLKDPQITTNQIEKALKTVGLYDAVKNLPDGLNTKCEESTFSQGQFQLLSIARAIVLNPKLLLFDEITANLDKKTETMVLKALNAAAESRTTISVSHHAYENLTGMKKRCIYI